MKRILLFVLPVFLVGIVQAQSPLMEMVNNEKSFAAYAGSVGITEAFVKYLDDSAVVFEKGKIANGREVWKDRKTEGMGLRWYPEFAEVAASGDFGYSTGPSEFRVKKGSEKADHKGYFNSIWRKNSNGEWKVVLDMGTPSPQSVYDESHVEYADGSATNVDGKKNIENELAAVEKTFIDEYAGGKAYGKYGSGKARYYRPGMIVEKGAYPYSDTLKLAYRNAGTEIASSGDLGYAYGYVDVSGKTGNYLRVWKKEMNGWRIVLDAATY